LRPIVSANRKEKAMRVHVSLNVKDVSKSVTFYSKIFGTAPQKMTGTYAKFDLQSPPLNFAMQSGGTVSQVSHLGIEVDTPAEVQAWKEKLIATGQLKAEETDSTCCYARQDKVWFSDPDGNEWEVFHVYEQLPISETPKKGACCG
jgi:catechol 2,3-dioxygenase-like lactoylglutathione lyase family enzyme